MQIQKKNLKNHDVLRKNVLDFRSKLLFEIEEEHEKKSKFFIKVCIHVTKMDSKTSFTNKKSCNNNNHRHLSTYYECWTTITIAVVIAAVITVELFTITTLLVSLISSLCLLNDFKSLSPRATVCTHFFNFHLFSSNYSSSPNVFKMINIVGNTSSSEDERQSRNQLLDWLLSLPLARKFSRVSWSLIKLHM